MDLFLLSINNWRRYDLATGFVIAAKNEADARLIARLDCTTYHREELGASEWQDDKLSTCQLIGSGPQRQPSIILRQFRAG